MPIIPTHRDQAEMQPEVCDVCGLRVGGHRLIRADVEGLRGRLVCDTDSCKKFRSALSFNDKARLTASRATPRQRRYYEAGMPSPMDIGD